MDTESTTGLEKEDTASLDVSALLTSETPLNNAQSLDQPDDRKVRINISGQKFTTTFSTLIKWPETKLGQLVHQQPTVSYYFFENDADVFKEVLKFYHTKEIHCPPNVCFSDFLDHLTFWQINVGYISDCCSQTMNEEMTLNRQFQYFDRRLQRNATCVNRYQNFAFYLWAFLTDPYGPNTKWKLGSKLWMVFYLSVTVLSGLCTACTTLPNIWQYDIGNSTGNETDTKTTGAWARAKTCEEYVMWRGVPMLKNLHYINGGLGVFYFVEVWTRFLCCPSKRFFWKSINGMDMVIGNVECLALSYMGYMLWTFLPDYASYPNFDSYCIAADSLEMVIIIVGQLRFLRLLGYASIYSGLKVLLITLYRSWREILLLIVLLGFAVVLFGPVVYVMTSPSKGQRGAINSIPQAYWYVIITMTTVGYGVGDSYPTTVPGYIVTFIVILAGITITALPIAIVGGNFTVVYEHNKKYEQQRQKLVVRQAKKCSYNQIGMETQ